MYVPRHFAETRIELLHAFLREHPLATIVVSDAAGLSADHVPLTLRADQGPQGSLLGHVARANPLWRRAGDGRECLVVFHGAQHYISPNGYATKHDDGRVVPTWNYEVVHAEGRIRAVDDAARLRVLLEELTAEHEHSQPVPWRVDDAPADYFSALVKAVVGIRIEITALIGKFKLSQNQPARNRHSLVVALRDCDDPGSRGMADAIARHACREE